MLKAYLRYWSMHAVFCATPSFIFAIFVGFNQIASIIAMILAVVTFIFFYSVASLKLSRIGGELKKAIHCAAAIRSCISAIGLVGLTLSLKWESMAALAAPDIMAGIVAVTVVSNVIGLDSFIRSFPSRGPGGEPEQGSTLTEFICTYLSTIAEGVILSGTLLLLVLPVFIVVRFRARRRRSVAADGNGA